MSSPLPVAPDPRDQQPTGDTLTFVRPRAAVPEHYDDYKVFKSPLVAFLDAARQADVDRVVRPVRRGETIDLL